MKNVLLLSHDGVCNLIYDTKPNFKTIINVWNKNIKTYPHECEGVFFAPTQRHGEAMYIQSRILRDLKIEYDYVASYNHDLIIKVSEINECFDRAAKQKLDCFSPSQKVGCYQAHKQFLSKGKGQRDLPWLEMMSVGFSKRMYERLMHHMDALYGTMNLIGGWGLDIYVFEMIIRLNKYSCKIFDDIVVDHIKKITSGKIKWRNGLTSSECMTIIKRYCNLFEKKSPSLNVLKRGLIRRTQKSRIKYTRQPEPKPYKLLFVRLSCAKEKSQWKNMRRKGVNQIILCGNPKLDVNYKLVDDILYVKAGDTYEKLPEKMIAAFSAILEMEEFKDISHIIKIDQDIDIKTVSEFCKRRKGFIERVDYSGGKVQKSRGRIGSNWHFGKVPKSSRWYNKKFIAKTVFHASGGHGYTLSRHALEVITNEYNFNNLSDVAEKYILEDLMVALILDRADIHPKDLGLKVKNTSSAKAMVKIKNAERQAKNNKPKAPKSKPKSEKNLVVQIYMDNGLITDNPKPHTNPNRGPLISAKMINDAIFQDSQDRARAYAKRCGADYVLFDTPVINFFSASMERMRLIEDDYWANTYDNILYLDCDAIIEDHCPDLFDLYPQKTLRVCPALMHKKYIVGKEKTMTNKFGAERMLKEYFNAGVILFHKSSLRAMKGKIDYRGRFNTYAFDDQSELNYVRFDNDIPMTMMHRKFNDRPGKGAMITHYLGNMKRRYHK